MSPNDVRSLENLDLIPEEEGGNFYMVNGNMMQLKYTGSAYDSYYDDDKHRDTKEEKEEQEQEEKNNGQTTENKEDKPNEEVLEMEEHKEHSKKRGNRRKFHTGRESPNT